jgi:hypothetical protein
MGQYASPFPVLHLLAIPFYWLGDVAYLEIFCFILASISIFKYAGLDKALIFNIILIASPAFWWEIAGRSELFSNLLLVVLFIYIVFNIKLKSKTSLLIIGFISGLLLCTRGITIIPLLVFLGFFLKNIPPMQKIKIFLMLSLGFIIPFIPLALWDFKLFIEFNPIFLQTNKTPLVVQIMAILLATFVGWMIKKEKYVYFHSFLILFTIMLTTFLLALHSEGWQTSIFQHHFDLSYFSTSLPFLIFGLLENLKQSAHKTKNEQTFC